MKKYEDLNLIVVHWGGGILGNPRIWDGFVDMGAYEYGPCVGL